MSRRERVINLRDRGAQVLPSLLMCDFGNLEREVRQLEDAGIQALHLDVMDGHFVPNLTYGMPIVEALRRITTLPLDVHLMISEPQRYAAAFCEAGADAVTFHVEAVEDPAPILEQIRGLDVAAGLALNPGTDLNRVERLLDGCDLVLVMSVEAGFGGQSFNPVALDKLRRLRDLSPDLVLEVDGGINTETIAACRAAGADWLVVGSAIFRQSDYRKAVKELAERVSMSS